MKKLSELPRIEEWSLYIGRPLCTWSNVAYVDCLRSEPIVLKALQGCSDAVKRNFLRECHGFLMEFLKVLNVSSYSTSLLASSLSCLSPDMLLQGDEAYTVSLFRELVSCLQACGRLSSVEAEGASNEIESLLVDLRRKNRRVVSTIKNSFSFLHESGLLGCRVHLAKVILLWFPLGSFPGLPAIPGWRCLSVGRLFPRRYCCPQFCLCSLMSRMVLSSLESY